MITNDAFVALMENIGISPKDADYSQFALYCGLLQEWNQQVNLTSITDNEGIAIKHFADSLLPMVKFALPPNCKLIDVGTGAGFPSVPMGLVRPDIQLTLLDSLEKRLAFLRHLCAQLGIEAAMVHARAEDAGKSPLYREQFDVATSRAVASLAELAEYCLPLVKVGGVALALKGSAGHQEAEDAKTAVELCGGKIEEVVDYTLPNGDPRTLVILRKTSPTPPKYPRNSAQISKKHL